LAKHAPAGLRRIMPAKGRGRCMQDVGG
jgi:hypothetical protein